MIKKLMILIFWATTSFSCHGSPAIGAITEIESIADAIFLAEGGERAKVPFGILSVPCEGYEDCRKICLNTVRNNIKRWEAKGSPGDFLDFLGARYAPVGSSTDNGTNQYWVGNVRFFLEGR